MDKAPELQKGRKSGGSCNHQLLSWRAPISSIPGDRQMINSGDQVIGDRQNKHIAEDEGGADNEGGRRDHREGVREHPDSPVPVKIALPKLAMH